MKVPSDNLEDWSYYTGYVEQGKTFIVTYPVKEHDKEPRYGKTPSGQLLPPPGPLEQLRRGDFFLMPYSPFPGSKSAIFMLTKSMIKKQIQNVILQAGDVCLSPYPRSGCTWTEQMVLLLLANGQDELLNPSTKNAYDPRQPHRLGKILIDTLFHEQPAGIDLCAPWGSICGQDYPYTAADVRDMNVHPVIKRVFKTHLQPCFAVGGINQEGPPAPGAKYIIMVRDPKDVVISLFRMNSLNLKALGMQFPPFVKLFLNGNTYLPSWTQYHVEWFALVAKHPEQFLILTYESALSNPREAILSIAGFLGLTCNEEVIDRCVKYSSFNHMKERAKSADAEHVHVGKAGGWRDCMTKEMVEEFNHMLDDERLGKYGKMYQVNVNDL